MNAKDIVGLFCDDIRRVVQRRFILRRRRRGKCEMVDREKVIKGLECLAQAKEPTANPCKSCGYISRPNFAFCVKDVAVDALELLKELQGILHKKQDDINKLCTENSQLRHKLHDDSQDGNRGGKKHMMTIEQALDGLERLRFFNQREGRELWFDKPKDIQEEDIKKADKIYIEAIALLKELKHKTGHWIFNGGKAYEAWSHNCSECGQRMTTAVGTYANYCSNCGSKMSPEKEETPTKKKDN